MNNVIETDKVDAEFRPVVPVVLLLRPEVDEVEVVANLVVVPEVEVVPDLVVEVVLDLVVDEEVEVVPDLVVEEVVVGALVVEEVAPLEEDVALSFLVPYWQPDPPWLFLIASP